MSEKCKRLHETLERLPIIKYPFDLKCLPESGIYFFYEKGEMWGHGGNKPRIVRIGTHKKNNFKSRMADHYLIDRKIVYDVNKPKPSDRSIFRKNLGRAILNKNNDSYLQIWNVDFTLKENRNNMKNERDLQKEKEIENQISCLLEYNFFFRFIIFDNEEKRIGTDSLEKRLIGTVANCTECQPSNYWLGKYSSIEKIRRSGLWIVQYLQSESIDEKDMLLIEDLISKTLQWIENNNERCKS